MDYYFKEDFHHKRFFASSPNLYGSDSIHSNSQLNHSVHEINPSIHRPIMTAIKKSSSKSNSLLDIPILNTTTAIALWLAVTTVVPLKLSSSRPNALGIAILGFNNLNILIAFCEIVLGNYITIIQQDFRKFQQQYPGQRRYQAAFAYLLYPLSLRTVLSGRVWSQMWSTYSLWDPSYSNPESFGFFIDVGNGWSTIVPCLLWNVAILCPQWIHSNELDTLVGFVGACSYWQVLYGTIIYLLSFVWNKRYQGKPLAEVLGFVGVSNGIWFVFPLFALYASYQMLLHKDCTRVFHLS
ncbi:hypothetical protein IV203_014541 [Nitzschia inconspicua]|uniref:Uncharacterized protein n=1 Tax=Nitzschia inconspicua TaxID=303405 RepID=A0A9K3LA11_9STRA|nr:hypothetical protein IV203_014541 [Nitzschia inconspicua]